MDLKELIEKAWDNKSLVSQKETSVAIKTIIDDLDNGKRRIAENIDGEWVVHEWI